MYVSVRIGLRPTRDMLYPFFCEQHSHVRKPDSLNLELI